MTNEQLRVATKNFMEMRFGSVKEAEDPDRWYERFGLIYDALTEVMPREYEPGEAIWEAACKAQRAADSTIGDGLIPGSWPKHINNTGLVPFDPSAISGQSK